MIARSGIVIPDGDEARGWAEDELAKPQYADAKPTWFDLWARDVGRFLRDLFTADGGGSFGPLALTILVVVLVAALVAAVLFWGIPRASRTVSTRRSDLLGSRDDRSAAQLRAEAERSAKSGDWNTATVLRFRALARGLIERDLIDPAPGATAHGIAREAATVFAEETEALRGCARAFDEVRYLDHSSTETQYRWLSDVDDRLAQRRPEAVPV